MSISNNINSKGASLEDDIIISNEANERAAIDTPMFIEAYMMKNPDLCDVFIKCHEVSEKHKGVSSLGLDEEVKSSIDSYLDGPLTEKMYIHIFRECLPHYFNKYKRAKECIPTIFNRAQVQYYEPRGGFKVWHCEKPWTETITEESHKNIIRRHLVYLTYLNDVEGDGGETEFLYQNFSVKPKKGLTIIFPAEWMFTHRGIPADSVKVVVTGWISHKYDKYKN